jgi:hypothetical protein
MKVAFSKKLMALMLVAFATGCTSAKPSPAPPPVPATLAGREPDSYSATVVRSFERDGEKTVSETRIARDGGMRRDEWLEDGRRLAALVRPDLGMSYLVDLDRNVYVETPLAPSQSELPELDGDAIEELFQGTTPEATVERTHAGTEIVEGRSCEVIRSRIEAESGGVSEGTVWEASELGGLVIRSEVRGPFGDLVVTELRDIRVPADPSLFEIPPAAKRVDSAAGDWLADN